MRPLSYLYGLTKPRAVIDPRTRSITPARGILYDMIRKRKLAASNHEQPNRAS